MIKIALAMVLGSAVVFYANLLPDRYWIAYFPILLIAAFFIPRYRFLILFAASCLWTGFSVHQGLDARLNESFDNQIVRLSGEIIDIPEQRDKSIRFQLKPDFIENYPGALPDKIRLSWYRNDQQPQAGQRWQLLAKLRLPAGFQNPGGFDYERWLFAKGIGATGYVRASAINQKIGQSSLSFISRWRTAIKQGIDRRCAKCPENGLIKALSIGYRGDIDPQHRQILQDTGTAHLLAISGLHIGIVSGLFYFIGGRFWKIYFHRLRVSRPLFSASLAVSSGLIYAALAGFSLPTVRALIMLAIIFLALSLRTGVNLLNSIALAVIVILLIDPLAIGSASFWLSISALLIIAFGQYRLTYQRQAWRQLVLLQLLFSLFFVPISILLFDQLNPASFLANIIAIPVVSFFIVPLAMLGSLFNGLDWFIADWLFVASDFLLGWLLAYLNLLRNSGLAALDWGGIPTLVLCLSMLGLVLLWMPIGSVGRKPAVILILIPFLWQRSELEHGSYRLTVFDVGMGTSVMVNTRKHSLVYDFGPGNNRGFSSARWVLEPFMRYQGIRDPDLLIISHVDQDHSGGFYSYRVNHDTTRLLSGTVPEVKQKFAMQTMIRPCQGYPAWSWDGVSFEFLDPPGNPPKMSNNNRSCVLRISNFHTTLLTGDIESMQEHRLVEAVPEKLAASVLLVPHHGSNTSSTLEFLQAVNPQYSLFTVGKNNRWGFPKPEVIENHKQIASLIFRTDQQGAITVVSDGEGLTVNGQRKTGSKFW